MVGTRARIPASFRRVAKAPRIAKAANIAKFSHHPASYLLSLRLFPRLLSPASDFCSQREVFSVYIMLPSSSRQPTLLSSPHAVEQARSLSKDSDSKRRKRKKKKKGRKRKEKTAVSELSTAGSPRNFCQPPTFPRDISPVSIAKSNCIYRTRKPLFRIHSSNVYLKSEISRKCNN